MKAIKRELTGSGESFYDNFIKVRDKFSISKYVCDKLYNELIKKIEHEPILESRNTTVGVIYSSLKEYINN